MKRAHRHLSHAVSVHIIRRAMCMRKMTCKVYLSTIMDKWKVMVNDERGG